MRRKWAIKHDTTNKLDGRRVYFEGDAKSTCNIRLFETRREARDYIRQKWAYLKDRPDLRAEPFCWRVPKATRVEIEVKEVVMI